MIRIVVTIIIGFLLMLLSYSLYESNMGFDKQTEGIVRFISKEKLQNGNYTNAYKVSYKVEGKSYLVTSLSCGPKMNDGEKVEVEYDSKNPKAAREVKSSSEWKKLSVGLIGLGISSYGFYLLYRHHNGENHSKHDNYD